MNYYFDMDGVLAIYERQAYKTPKGSSYEQPLWLRPNAHYFRSCLPDKKMIEVMRQLAKDKRQNRIFVLTSITNRGHLFVEHVTDKCEWLKQHCAGIDYTFLPVISAKRCTITDAKKSRGNCDILIDDYNKNLIEWAQSGGVAVKYCNGINSPNHPGDFYTFSGLHLEPEMSVEEIVNLFTLYQKYQTYSM